MENQNNQHPQKKSHQGLIITLIVIAGCVVAFLLAMIIGLIAVGVTRGIVQYREDTMHDVSEDIWEVESQDVFAGTSYQASDSSVIYFEEDGSYIWYQNDTDHTDNYYLGTYDVYLGGEAEDYIVNDLSDYGVTREKLEDYYDMNSGSDFYVEDNFCCLVLHTDELIVDGENQADEPYDKNYMGFYSDGYYDAANMDSAQYVYFTLVE